MKIKFFRNGKTEQNVALLSKFKVLRVKIKVANKLGFNDNERYLIGADIDEIPVKHIYVIQHSFAL